MSQSLSRALRLLAQVAEQPGTLDELAAGATVHKTTVMRLLHALEEEHFLARTATGQFHLGRKVFELSARALEQRDLRVVARPHLARLNEVTGHTVHLAELEGSEVVYIDKFESHHPVRMYSRIGLTAALHSAAVAKVILADLPVTRQQHLAAGIDYVPLTETTLRTPQALLQELRRVREQGWAQDRSEHEAFVHCVAAPIRDAGGTVVGAASVSVPVVLLDYPGLLNLLPTLKQATQAISRELGWVATERTTR